MSFRGEYHLKCIRSECNQSPSSATKCVESEYVIALHQSTNLKYLQNADPIRNSLITSPVFQLSMQLRHQMIRKSSHQKALQEEKSLFHFHTLCETGMHQKVHHMPFPKTTPSPDGPPTGHISACYVEVPLITHSPHKMLDFELLSATIQHIAAEVQPPQRTTPQFIVLL